MTEEKISFAASGKTEGWRVEARYDYPEPLKITDDFSLTKEWREIHFPRSDKGIPCGGIPLEIFAMAGVYSYEQAEALRWSFMAKFAADYKICVETRLVLHVIEYDVKAKRGRPYASRDMRGHFDIKKEETA